MRSAFLLFVLSVLLLIAAGAFAGHWFAGVLLAGGLGGFFGTLNAFLGGLRND